jgi:hypothetical protein
MRTLLMLLLVVMAFVVIRLFSPTAEPKVGATDAGEGAHFLAPPAAVSAPEVRPAPLEVVPQANLEVATGKAAWILDLELEPGATDETRIAAALVHGKPAEVQAAAAQLERERAQLLESFAWAVAGERQMALSLSEKIHPETVEATEKALFEAALTGRGAFPASGPRGPVALAMEMALAARDVRRALSERKFSEAARGFSDLLIAELSAPWGADARTLGEWTEGLDVAQREHRWNPRGTWPAQEIQVGKGDSLIQIRTTYLKEHPNALLCTGLIERANRLKGYLQPGQVLRVPTDPVRIEVDLSARWALYFLGDEVAAAWPVGIGRPGEETPPGDYLVKNKLENPSWMKEGQEPIPFGDHRNPLGTRWIGWSRDGAKTSYGFHGTWQPESIGQAASDGCVRFLNEDVEELFQILPEGAPIRIQG